MPNSQDWSQTLNTGSKLKQNQVVLLQITLGSLGLYEMDGQMHSVQEAIVKKPGSKGTRAIFFFLKPCGNSYSKLNPFVSLKSDF